MSELVGEHALEDGGSKPRKRTASRLNLQPRPVVIRLNRQYSRFVSLMRYVLPIIAIVMVAVVVIWPGLKNDGKEFQLSFSDLAVTEENVAMHNARYLGEDSQQQPYVVTADKAVQDNADPERVSLVNLQADITLKAGDWISLTAPTGLYQRDADTLSLDAPVNVFLDNGVFIEAGGTFVEMAAGTARSDEAVHGQGPMGTLDAASFRYDKARDVLHFAGDVRVVILPASGGEARE